MSESAVAGDEAAELAGKAAALAETNRLETFSDGVFAIANTLLLLEIKVPTIEEAEQFGGIARALASRWPSYVGYVISFGTLGIMWANHHAIFRYIRRTARAFLPINGIATISARYRIGPVAYLAATALAFVSVSLSLAVHAGLALLFAKGER